MSMDNCFPRKPKYCKLKIEYFDELGMTKSEKTRIEDFKVINSIKELITKEINRQMELQR